MKSQIALQTKTMGLLLRVKECGTKHSQEDNSSLCVFGVLRDNKRKYCGM